jgi:hypothetical protein
MPVVLHPWGRLGLFGGLGVITTGPWFARIVDSRVADEPREAWWPTLIWSASLGFAVGATVAAASLVPRLRDDATVFGPIACGSWGVAVLVRCAALVHVLPRTVDFGDPIYYHSLANHLAAGRGFVNPYAVIAAGVSQPTALHPPLYSMLLSVSSFVGGTATIDHRMLSLLVGALVVVPVGVLARRLAGRTTAVVAMLAAALMPTLWMYAPQVFAEGLYAVLAAALVAVLIAWIDTRRRSLLVATGAMVGLAALTRGEGAILLVTLVAPVVALTHRSWRRSIRDSLIVAIVAISLIAPWTVFASVREGQFIPLSTNAATVIAGSNCEPAYSGRFIGSWVLGCYPHSSDPATVSEAEWVDEEGAAGRAFIRANLDDVPRVIAARVGRQWELFRPRQGAETVEIESHITPGVTRAATWSFYAVAALAVPGLVILRKRRRPISPFVAMGASVTVTAALTYGQPRFRAGLDPLLCVLAAVAVVEVVQSRASATTPVVPRRSIVALGSTVALALALPGLITDAMFDAQVRRSMRMGSDATRLERVLFRDGRPLPAGWKSYGSFEPGRAGLSTGAGTGDRFAWAEHPGGELEVEAVMAHASAGTGLVVRRLDERNYWLIVAAPAYATWNVTEVVDGVRIEHGPIGLASSSPGVRIGARFSRDHVTVVVLGQELATFAAPPPSFGTGAGLFAAGTDGDRPVWSEFATFDSSRRSSDEEQS